MKISRTFEKNSVGQSSSVALGLFDGVHIGHQAVLNQALMKKDLAHCVFTYTMTSTIPENKKNLCFLSSEEEKWNLLEKMGFELVVCPDFKDFKEMEPQVFVEEMLIRRMAAQEISCGENFTFGKNAQGTVADLIRFAAPYQVHVNVVKAIRLENMPVSSTRIREEILAGKMDEASRMLGRRYSIHFKVDHGNQLGRSIQFPTVNQIFPANHIVPKYGVYATVVAVNGHYYGGVTNVGVKPTVGCEGPLAETHILNFDGNLYDERVEVFFFRFVRSEQKFSSIEELKAQIGRDKEAVMGDTAENIQQLLAF